jgi:hypothetical protein
MDTKNCVVLDITGSASLLIKEYRQSFRVRRGHYLEIYLQQHTIALWVDIDVVDVDPGVAAGHTLYFLHYGSFQFWALIFKNIAPETGTITRFPGHLSCLYIKSVGEISLDQFKIREGEFFELIDGVESDEGRHVSIYAAGRGYPMSAKPGNPRRRRSELMRSQTTRSSPV